MSSATKYERVTYVPEDESGRQLQAHTIYLQDVSTTQIAGHLAIRGAEVDREGCPLNRIHLLSADLVRNRIPVVMDLHYGELRQPREGEPTCP